MDAGFTTTSGVCSNNLGSCSAGTDLTVCGNLLSKQCGASAVVSTMFLDDCGAHANPYHYHTDLRCEYQGGTSSTGGYSTATAHSPMIALALDGRGIYGQWESGTTAGVGSLPTNLDPCGGHKGTVPTTVATVGTYGSSQTVTFTGASSVYHYHIVDGGPTSINCFGYDGTTTTAQAKALYSSYCSATAKTFCTSKGTISYALYCPIFNQQATTNSYTGNSGVSSQLTYTSSSCTCSMTTCTSSYEDAIVSVMDSTTAASTLSVATVAIIVAVVSLSASAVLYFLQSRMAKSSAALLSVPPTMEMPTVRPSAVRAASSQDRFYRL